MRLFPFGSVHMVDFGRVVQVPQARRRLEVGLWGLDMGAQWTFQTVSFITTCANYELPHHHVGISCKRAGSMYRRY